MDQKIINNLLQKDAPKKPLVWPEKVIKDNSQTLITKNRVVSIRYKVYFVFILFLWIRLGIKYVYPSYEDWQDSKLDLQELQGKTSIFEARKKRFEKEKTLIEKIVLQEKTIISSFNEWKWYSNLDPIIQNNSGVVRSYLQLNNLQNDKMIIDERVILANINEFLLRDQSSERKSRNGIINKIAIWEPETYSENLYHIPIEINVTFNDKDGLMSFIENVEKHILPDPKYRILYKINEIVYDIVNYEERQDVQILLSAYYYYRLDK